MKRLFTNVAGTTIRLGQKYYLGFLFLSLPLMCWGQNVESFSNLGPYGGYQTETWSGDNGFGTWTATDARTDQSINGKAITVRNGMLTSPSITGGIGDLTLTTQRKFGGTSDNLVVTINGDTVGTIAYTDTVATHSIAGIDVSGSFVLEILTPGNGDRVAMDDLTWTGYGAPATYNITFQVDMSAVGAIHDTVSVAGDFQVAAGYPGDWSPGTSILTDPDGDSVYTLTVQLPAGNYEFKYINGNQWGQDENVPSACAQNNNRYLNVSGDDTLGVVCFASCFPCGYMIPQKLVVFQVDMSQETVSPNGVHVAGDFQGWDPGATMLTHQGSGIYTYQVLLDSGNTYEYKYINGNAWGDDEQVPGACAQNSNRYFTLKNDTVLPAVLFGTCAPAPPPHPVYPISMVTTVDTNGVADSLGVDCEIRGTVISTNFRSGGLEFFIHDGTGGIGLFSSSNTYGYTVNIGDSVHIQGTISQFNGLAQISPDTVILAVANHRTPVPTVVDSLGEYTEAELVRINNATLVNPGQWPNPGSNANVDIQVGSRVLTMRIDRDTDVDDLVSAPTGAFAVIGVGSQFDGSSPYTSGYQVLPRMASDIMMHTFGVTCGDLFFSEYIEGSSNNKGFEIFNPTSDPIDLSNYEVQLEVNGGQFLNVFNPVGMLSPGDVFVVSNDQADTNMTKVADTLLGFPNVANHTGDDALMLINLVNGDTLDIIGELNNRPAGGSWPVGSGSTQNHTLIRKPNVYNGTTNWTVGATQWDVYPNNTFDSLGAHYIWPCGTTVDPDLAYNTSLQDIDESAGPAIVSVIITSPNNDTTQVEAYVKGGTAVNGTDFQFTDTVLTFLPNDGTPQSLSVTIIDNSVQEPNRTIILGLRNATNNATISLDTTVINILDDDTPIPVYPIATVHTEDADGVADSLGVYCELRGIVTTLDYRSGNGLQFYMSDATGGINVFSFNDVGGYVVTPGDSLHVIGSIDQFRGLTEIIPDSIHVAAQGLDIPDAFGVTQLGEMNESELVYIYGLTIIDTMEWTNSGSGFNVRFTNAAATDTFVIRIDNDAEPFGEPSPELGKYYIITGVVTQFNSTSSAPFLDGYQLQPRFNSDIVEILAPEAGFEYEEDPLLEVAFTDTSSNDPVEWSWTFGDGGTSNDQHPTYIYAAKGTYEVCLTASNPAGNSTTCDSITVGPVGIEEGADVPVITIYPVPASSTIRISSDVSMEMVRLIDVQGRVVSSTVANGDWEFSLDVQHLANGVYILEVETAKGLLRSKVAKQ